MTEDAALDYAPEPEDAEPEDAREGMFYDDETGEIYFDDNEPDYEAMWLARQEDRMMEMETAYERSVYGY